MSGHRYRVPADPFLALFDSKSDAARKLGIARRSIQRWSVIGFPLHRSDELAASAGFHPLEVWGDAWLAAWDERDEAKREKNRAWKRRAKAGAV